MAAAKRPPWWYFVLALVVVPLLWLPVMLVLAAALTMGPGGATIAAVLAAGAGVGAIVGAGRMAAVDQRWIVAAVVAAFVAGAIWSVVIVLAFLGIACDADPCFN